MKLFILHLLFGGLDQLAEKRSKYSPIFYKMLVFQLIE